jgi:hypothetical protein
VVDVRVPRLRSVLAVVAPLAVEAAVGAVVAREGIKEVAAVHATEAVAVVPSALKCANSVCVLSCVFSNASYAYSKYTGNLRRR